jgi:hypothetical protein
MVGSVSAHNSRKEVTMMSALKTLAIEKIQELLPEYRDLLSRRWGNPELQERMDDIRQQIGGLISEVPDLKDFFPGTADGELLRRFDDGTDVAHVGAAFVFNSPAGRRLSAVEVVRRYGTLEARRIADLLLREVEAVEKAYGIRYQGGLPV